MIYLDSLFNVIQYCNSVVDIIEVPQYFINYCSQVYTYTLSEYFNNNIENYTIWYEKFIEKYY